MSAQDSLGAGRISQAVAAAKQLVFVARSGDDSARWGDTYVKIRAKHLDAFLRATEGVTVADSSLVVGREYSVVYSNGHRVMLRDYEDAERFQKLTRGRVEWRTGWKPFDAHPLGCDCLLCDPDVEADV